MSAGRGDLHDAARWRAAVDRVEPPTFDGARRHARAHDVAAGLQIDEPSTARVNEFLANLDIAAPVLVVTSDEPAVAKSVRNLFYAESAEVGALSTEQVLRARSLVLTEKAFDALNQA